MWEFLSLYRRFYVKTFLYRRFYVKTKILCENILGENFYLCTQQYQLYSVRMHIPKMK